MDEKTKQDFKDFTEILLEHNRLLGSLKKELEEFKTENRMRDSIIELRLANLETRHDNHSHRGYQQRTTVDLYNNKEIMNEQKK